MDINIIKKGFNNGYILRTHRPEMAAIVLKTLEGREDEYAEGLRAGINQREKELLKDKTRNYDIRRTGPPAKSRTKGKNIGDRDR